MQDQIRLKQEYAEHRLRGKNVYSPFNVSYLFTIQQRQRAVIELLRRAGHHSFENRHILEIGCGQGDVLYDFLFFRLLPYQLQAVEFIPDEIKVAHGRFPGLPLTIADAQALPYRSQSFDVVVQYTVFSSILDGTIKFNIAQEMLRILKPDGTILWYDFWLNPTNPQTRGVRKAEIKQLFPACKFTFRRITLAPPLARRPVPVSWTLCFLLEKLSILNTHFLVAIKQEH